MNKSDNSVFANTSAPQYFFFLLIVTNKIETYIEKIFFKNR